MPALFYVIIGFFSLAILLGMVLLGFVMGSKETPKAVVFSHGPLAIIGLVLLVIYLFRGGPNPWESVILFTLAAMGGLVLAARDLSGKAVPKWLAVAHGFLAVTGFVLLLFFALLDWSWLGK